MFTLALLVACARQPSEVPMPAGFPDVPPSEAVDGDPFAPIFGDPVELEALYMVSPVAGSKRLQPVTLVFEDEEWIRSYRPIRAELQFVEKRVVVRGRPYHNPPAVQSVQATHIEVASIELAPGETPWAEIPTGIPAPPQARSLSEIEARSGLWVHALGTLVHLAPPSDSTPFWRTGTLALTDGALELPAIPNADNDVEGLVGETVTVLGQVAPGPMLQGPVRVCPGEVASCRMDQDNFIDP